MKSQIYSSFLFGWLLVAVDLSSAIALPKLAANCLPAYTADVTYVGCYSDADTRTLSGAQVTSIAGNNTPQSCGDVCGLLGHTYAGVEYSSQCYCGSTILGSATKEADGACTMACAGNSSETCGGTWLVDIYQISNPLSIAENGAAAGLPDCTREPLCSNPVCDTSLSMEERVAGIVNALTLEEKAANMMNGAPGSSRIGLPAYQWWSEALHGVASSPGVSFSTPLGSNWSYATSFPTPILMGASFDDALINKVATVVGTEARAFGNNGRAGFDFWTPNINPFRDPRWGRGLETPGEDPYHLQNYVYNLITGLQGGLDPEVKQIIATCKHFAVYDIETNRHEIDLDPTAQELSEYYLLPFKTCARDAKVGAVMCSYNAVDGIPSCANRYLLQTVLREHWGWSDPYNWVTSDCAAVTDISDNHDYVQGHVNAAAAALNAGTDLACEDTIYNNLVQAVEGNVTTEASLDRSLTRLYSSLIKVGYFNAPSEYASLGWANVGTPAAQTLAYEAAVEGIALLKNNGVLPLPKTVSNVAIIGPWGAATTQMQGNYQGVAPFLISPLAAMQAKWSNVKFSQGTNINTTSTANFSDALAIASEASYIIYCGGIDTSIEAEGMDRTTITWPGNQLDLINQLAALNKPMIVVQFGGGQLDDTSLLNNTAIDALVWAGYPGQDGGDALRDLLDGTKSIAGRLPITQYPANYISLNMLDPNLRPNATTGNPGRTYKWYDTPVLPFGYGLHYTNFSFAWNKTPQKSYSISSLVYGAPGILENAAFDTATIKVTNKGGPANLASDYVGLLFISTKNAGPSPYPLKSLASYDRLFGIPVGETQELSLPMTLATLARADSNGNFVLYPGDYTIGLDVDSKITYSFSLTGEATTIESVPLVQPTPVPMSYLGCYTDAQSERTLSGPLIKLDGTNFPQLCADQCNKAGYPLSGVEYGVQCFCGSSLAHKATLVDDSKCNYVCPGDSFESCGGVWYLNIYNATPPATIEPPSWTG